MEPLTTLGAGLAVLGSKDLLNKILGPTADYIGSEAKGLAEKCNINLNHVFARAKEKLGARLEEPGAVSPRVLRHVYEDGRFAEDEIVVEYYGGLLAGSKTDSGKDDQALPYLAKVQQMSAHQLRLHFLFYYELLRIHRGSSVNLGLGNELHKLSLLIPHELFIGAFPSPVVMEKYWKIMAHSVAGLSEEGLVRAYSYGDIEDKAKDFENAPTNAIFLTPSFLGAELFMWALGIESPSGHDFFCTDIDQIQKIIPVNGFAFSKLLSAG